jgi:hypothetical protein
LIGWQLSIRNCCKPFFSLLHNCRLLCFWRLALSTVVEVFPWPFLQILLLQGCLLQTGYAQLYALSMSGVNFLIFLNVIFLLSPFVELKNAYDLVRREILYNIHDALGIHI